jgi:hypothetical protein
MHKLKTIKSSALFMFATASVYGVSDKNKVAKNASTQFFVQIIEGVFMKQIQIKYCIIIR